MGRIRSCINWLRDYIQNYNLFIPDDDDYNDDEKQSIDPAIRIKQQKYSTWLYVFLFISSLYALFFIALVSPQSRTVTISNITPFRFDQLSREHGETLSCPCSTITVSYNTFVISSALFHPVCSSVFVSREWIETFYLPIANAYLVADFRTTAFAQFELLAALCAISKDTVSKALVDIQNSQFVTVELRQKNDVQSQVQATADLIQATASVQVTSFLRFLQMMYRSNTLVSALGTNVAVYIGFYRVVMTTTYYEIETGYTYNASCAEKKTVTSAAFYKDELFEGSSGHTYWPVYYDSFGRLTIWTTINGFFGACFPLDAILASTLDCLYQVQCIQILSEYFPKLNQSKLKWTAPLWFSGLQNISVNDLVSNLFIDNLSIIINYTNYFQQCAPSVCTYFTTDSTNFSYTITLFLSLYGGLTAILRLIAPFLIKTMWKIRHRSIKTPCLSFIHNKIQWMKHLNLFKSAANRTVDDIKEQRISTYCFLIALAGSLLSLILFNSLERQSITNIEHNPTLFQYRQLETLYTDTLTCPCSNTTMPYEEFVSLFPIFHQVCSSDLISDSWIASLRNSESTALNTNTWMNEAAQYFNLLATVCHLANATAIDNIHDFLARTFVSSNVLTETDFSNQLNTTVEQLIESIVIGFRLFMNLTRVLIQVDQSLVILDQSQVILVNINTSADSNNPLSLQFALKFNTVANNQSTNGICRCLADAQCQGSIVFATDGSVGLLNLPGVHLLQRPIAYTAPGLVTGCYNSDSLLFSTLQCFYNDKGCLQQMFNYMNKTKHLSTVNISPLIYNPASTRFLPNTLFSSIIEEMMIEQWNISWSFADYYQACLPTYCSYAQTEQANGFIKVIVAAISMIGGLIIVLRLVIFQLVKIALRLLQPKGKKRQRVRRNLSDHSKRLVRSLMRFLNQKVYNLNIFPARTFASQTDRTIVKLLGQWSTRLYLILLMITFVILTLYTVIQPQTLTKTFVKPSLNLYKSLINAHADTLECPCSLISSPYDRYVQIQPTFHQICSSGFVSDAWRLDLTTNLISNLSSYNPRDYRRFLSAHLQFLRGLCQLSNQTVLQSIQQSLSSLFITKQLLSEEFFHLRINSMINETKFNAPTTLIRLLALLLATNHGNAIVSSYGTNYQYRALTASNINGILYTEAVIYDDNCSCQLNFTCTIQASFIEMNLSESLIVKGLKMGCTPSESFLVSTLECFYDLACIHLIEQMTNYYSSSSPPPLNTNNTRFAVDMTVMDLIDDLFVESWSSSTNYSSYFEHCSPLVCSYTYIQQLNSFYTVTYFLGLYGGLTIVLQWISPKVIYLRNKVYQRRKKNTPSVRPTSSIKVATVETTAEGANVQNTDRITTFSQSTEENHHHACVCSDQHNFSHSIDLYIIHEQKGHSMS